MAPKPPKGGSISPVPPPLQFANFENASAVNKFSSSAAISASSSSSYSAQSKFTSNVSSQRSGTGVKVLPTLNQPVQLQEPTAALAITSKDHVDSINSNEADHFIEQLMMEAETDPKLRELTYGSPKNQQFQQQQQQANLNETYPMINRYYFAFLSLRMRYQM